MALPLFAATLFVSAFLLFLVQPMIGKMILPRLGGTPQVWNTCMVFFQMALLAGYAYTHTVTTRLSLRRQLIVHLLLLAVPLLILLPIGPFNVTWWTPPPGANPIPSTLLLLTIVVGLPFFVVATSAPLLQRWFASTGHPAAKDPYFLYGASNLGSMLGLLCYPFVVERIFRLQPENFAAVTFGGGPGSFDLGSQNWFWAIGYVILGILIVSCAVMVWKAPPSVALAGATEASALVEPPPPGAELVAGEPPVPNPASQITATAPQPPKQTGIRRGSKQRGRAAPQRFTPKAGGPAAAPPVREAPRPFEMTNWRRLRWVGLAAVPSSLMLGLTSYISVDISPMPMIWVVFLSFYLLSFVYVFARWPVVWTDLPHKVMIFVQPATLLLLVWLQLQRGFEPESATVLCLLGFFPTALLCHGELARDRPPTKYLTEFYLWMSVGGMLGGMFNALFAPLLFVGVIELPLAIVLAGLLRPRASTESWTEGFLAWLFPGMVESLANKGDEIARNYRKPAAGETEAESAASRRELPARGWLLSYALDILLPVLLGLLFFFVYTRASDPEGWRWNSFGRGNEEDLNKNPLWRFYFHTVGFGSDASNPTDFEIAADKAIRWTRMTFNVLVYWIPLLIAFLYFARPLRFGLAVAVLLLVNHWTERSDARVSYRDAYQEERLLEADRSYFGVMRVRETGLYRAEGSPIENYTYLMHGSTHHGLNYQTPESLRRVPTTYYHRFGPVGVIMEKLNWFPLTRENYPKIGTVKLTDEALTALREAKVPDPILTQLNSLKKTEFKSDEDFLKEITRTLGEKDGKVYGPLVLDLSKQRWNWHPYWSDARVAASLVGTGVPSLGVNLPLGQIVAAKSDPPYATVGLGTGTMASYGRPFQHVVFYEIDSHVRSFSFQDHTWPDGQKPAPWYNYASDAQKRGVELEVIMGDARLSMKQEDPQLSTLFSKREHYYRVIELDAFSSDAIPVHLITKEAIAMYFEKLIKPRDEKQYDENGKPVMKDGKQVVKHFSGGILMVHTSNRHVDLVQPVTDVAKDLGLKWRVGKDHGGGDRGLGADRKNPDIGRFGSEYVMLAVDERDLPPATLVRPPGELTKDFVLRCRREQVDPRTLTEGEPLTPEGKAMSEENPRLTWYTPRNPASRVWTDDYSNLLSVFRGLSWWLQIWILGIALAPLGIAGIALALKKP